MPKSRGYIKSYRKITEKSYWPGNERRPFTRFEAWHDMCLNLARGTDNGVTKRGQFQASLSFLAKRWTWTRSSVRRFLLSLDGDEISLVKHGSEQQAKQGMTQVIIRKYNHLNPTVKHEVKHLSEQQVKQNKRKIKERKNIYKGQTVKKADFERMGVVSLEVRKRLTKKYGSRPARKQLIAYNKERDKLARQISREKDLPFSAAAFETAWATVKGES